MAGVRRSKRTRLRSSPPSCAISSPAANSAGWRRWTAPWVGSIFLTDEGEGLSRLRLLYVEPTARGSGIGEALVAACIAYAREVGYAAVTLWTHTILESAPPPLRGARL